MDSDGLPLIGPGIDLSKVEAIHQKRTLAFLNHFITHTARFLNRFSCVCEEKLSHITLRIQRLETTMNILEAKLLSIPGLESVQVPVEASSTGTASQSPPSNSNPASDTTAGTSSTEQGAKEVTESKEEPAQTEAVTNPASQDSTYAQFFKMLKMGVPEMAVKQRMAIAGLDPNVLDSPDSPVPGGTSASQAKEDDLSDEGMGQSDSDESSVDFSD